MDTSKRIDLDQSRCSPKRPRHELQAAVEAGGGKVKIDPKRDLKWWGVRGIAHFFAEFLNEPALCGAVVSAQSTRLDSSTGEPWKRCKKCQRKLSQ